MSGKRDFTESEFGTIKQLLSQKLRASPIAQKGIRGKIRKLGFYISDFGFSPDGFGPQQLDQLRQQGRIRIIGSHCVENNGIEVPFVAHNQSTPVISSALSNHPNSSSTVNLKPFLRMNLDVLFVALNPPVQSNAKGHYFSGAGSRFFKLLALSGLTTREALKPDADEIVFGGNTLNYKNSQFGVVDLVEDLVETNSGLVQPTEANVDHLFNRIREYRPRYVCIIHSKVRDAINTSPQIAPKLVYGNCGAILRDSTSVFFLNYFPNGNAVPDEPKLTIFRDLRASL